MRRFRRSERRKLRGKFKIYSPSQRIGESLARDCKSRRKRDSEFTVQILWPAIVYVDSTKTWYILYDVLDGSLVQFLLCKMSQEKYHILNSSSRSMRKYLQDTRSHFPHIASRCQSFVKPEIPLHANIICVTQLKKQDAITLAPPEKTTTIHALIFSPKIEDSNSGCNVRSLWKPKDPISQVVTCLGHALNIQRLNGNSTSIHQGRIHLKFSMHFTMRVFEIPNVLTETRIPVVPLCVVARLVPTVA